jgi:hypothetical protein
MASGEYMSVAEARELLGISGPRMAQMIKAHELRWEPNPLDRRGKLLRRAEVEALAAKAGKKVAA